MKKYWSGGNTSFWLGVISCIVAISMVIFFFFYVPKQPCRSLRDPSGNLGSVCAPTAQSPYQRMYLALHQYFFPKDSCFISIETGNVDCQPFLTTGYNQSATTTDYSTLPSPSAQQQPYIPPNPVQPSEEWISATGTPITLSGFSFTLPSGWHGEVYDKSYGGGRHVLVQKNQNEPGFVIDCPPDGKGLEAASRLSIEEHSFITNDITYSVAFEKWTAPGNEPWYFVWVRAHQLGDSSADTSDTVCLTRGIATHDIEEAMRSLYDSWK